MTLKCKALQRLGEVGEPPISQLPSYQICCCILVFVLLPIPLIYVTLLSNQTPSEAALPLFVMCSSLLAGVQNTMGNCCKILHAKQYVWYRVMCNISIN